MRTIETGLMIFGIADGQRYMLKHPLPVIYVPALKSASEMTQVEKEANTTPEGSIRLTSGMQPYHRSTLRMHEGVEFAFYVREGFSAAEAIGALFNNYRGGA